MLDWAGLLLNAHYTQLVLMPEAHELLVSCHKLVAQQVRGWVQGTSCYEQPIAKQLYIFSYEPAKQI